MGVLPNCSSNGVSFIFECVVNLKFPSALRRDSFNLSFSGASAFIFCFTQPIVLSTSPALVWKFGVPNYNSMFSLPLIFFKFPSSKGCTLICYDLFRYTIGGNVAFNKFHRNLSSGGPYNTSYRPFRKSISPTNIHLFGPGPSLGPWKSSCNSSLGCEGYFNFFSVLGLLVFKFLPAW